MTRSPPLTPYQALHQLKVKEPLFIRDFKFYLDGPQGSPPDYWSPVAIHVPSETTFFPVGMPGDPITPETEWIF